MVNFDRTGKVIHATDFPTKVGFTFNALGTLEIQPYITANQFKYGVSSLHAKTSAGAANGLQAICNSRLWDNALISTEFGLMVDQTLTSVTLQIIRYKPGLRRYYVIRFVNNTSDIEVRQADGTYTVVLDTAAVQFPPGFYNVMKLDIDTSLDDYIRFRFNSDTYDLTGYGTFSDGGGTYDFTAISLIIYGNNLIATNIYLDHFILSEDE